MEDPVLYVDTADLSPNKTDTQKESQNYSISLIIEHWAIECNSLDASIQPIPYPLNTPSIKPVSLQFRGKTVARKLAFWAEEIYL